MVVVVNNVRYTSWDIRIGKMRHSHVIGPVDPGVGVRILVVTTTVIIVVIVAIVIPTTRQEREP